MIMPPAESATNKSPFGAVRISRGWRNVPLSGGFVLCCCECCCSGDVLGPLSPPAYSETLNPGGATGQAFSGRATILGCARTDSAGFGSGRSDIEIFRNVPGFSWLQSANAACPVTGPCLDCAPKEIAATAAMTVTVTVTDICLVLIDTSKMSHGKVWFQIPKNKIPTLRETPQREGTHTERRRARHAPRTPGGFAFRRKFTRVCRSATRRYRCVRLPFPREAGLRTGPSSPSLQRDSIHPRRPRNLDRRRRNLRGRRRRHLHHQS